MTPTPPARPEGVHDKLCPHGRPYNGAFCEECPPPQ